MHGGVRGRGSNPPTYSIIYANRIEIELNIIVIIGNLFAFELMGENS